MATTTDSILGFLESRASDTALTTDQVNALVTDLRSQLNQLSVDVPGTAPDAITVLYSGKLGGDIHTGAIAEAFRKAHTDKVRTIDMTALGSLLGSKEFREALESALGPKSEAQKHLMDGLMNGSRNATGAQQPDSLWDDASRRFTAAAQGDIVTFTPNATTDRVFGRTEMDTALNSSCPSINGIPREDLIRMRDAAHVAGKDGNQVVLDTVNGQSRLNLTKLQISLDADRKLITGVGTSEYFRELGLDQTGHDLPANQTGRLASELFDPNPRPTPAQIESAANAKWGNDQLTQYGQERFNLAEAAGDAGKLADAARYLNKLGTAGDILALTLVANEANAAYAAGDDARARQILSDWAADFTGGLAGGLAAAKLMSAALAPFYFAGPAGALIAGGLTLLAGLAGGFAGGHIATDIASLYTAAHAYQRQDVATQVWEVVRRDPLILDLDGDGIETHGIDTLHPIYFDHTGHGTLNPTGWVSSDDAFLVLDRNGNGLIDNGTELFGDSTPLSEGGHAFNGFHALAQEDTNQDSWVNREDERYGQLRLWRDHNQNGISEAEELLTLESQGILALRVETTPNYQLLDNGNVLANIGSYLRADGGGADMGTAQHLGDVDLVGDTFRRRFEDVLPLTEQARNLPDLQGSGQVRDLREAKLWIGRLAEEMPVGVERSACNAPMGKNGNPAEYRHWLPVTKVILQGGRFDNNLASNDEIWLRAA